MALQIILLDDDAMLLESLNELVPWADLGFEVIGAFTDSKSAIEFMEKHDVSAIITDICMPEMNGIELSQICKEKFPNLKIVFLSAYREFEYAQAAIYSGNVVDYITKPINYSEFKKRMNRLAAMIGDEVQKSSFSSSVELDERLQFFSSLLCGEIWDVQELAEFQRQQGIQMNPEKTPCSVVNFHIKNFSEMIRKKSKYNAIQMHHAISNLFPFETDNGYFALAIYSYGNLVWIVLHKNEDVNGAVLDFSEKFIQNMMTNLSADVSLKSHKTYESIAELIKDSDFEEIEQVGKDSNIDAAMAYMKDHFAENITLNDVARRVYMCPAYFSVYFKRCTGHTFIERLTKIRMENAVRMLMKTEMVITEIAIKTGYNHLGNFYEKFKKYYGMTPMEYRKYNKK